MVIIRFMYDNTHNVYELRNDEFKLYFLCFGISISKNEKKYKAVALFISSLHLQIFYKKWHLRKGYY
jgi:hypothetical protein